MDRVARKSGDRVGCRPAPRTAAGCATASDKASAVTKLAPHTFQNMTRLMPAATTAVFTKQTSRSPRRGYNPKLKVFMKNRHANFGFAAPVDFYHTEDRRNFTIPFQEAETAAPNTRAANCG